MSITNGRKKKTFECSKLILFLELIVLAIFIACIILVPEKNFEAITIAWIGNIAISTTAYYWKAKTENRVKVPLAIIESLPKEMLDKFDLTSVITAIVQSE